MEKKLFDFITNCVLRFCDTCSKRNKTYAEHWECLLYKTLKALGFLGEPRATVCYLSKKDIEGFMQLILDQDCE